MWIIFVSLLFLLYWQQKNGYALVYQEFKENYSYDHASPAVASAQQQIENTIS